MSEVPFDPEQSDALNAPDSPSVLYAFWPEPERPLEEEIRISLEAAYPGISPCDELETNDDVPWGTVFRLPGTRKEVAVWAELRADFSDDILVDGLTDPKELALARQARWMLGVETMLDPRQPLRSFQEQVQLLQHAVVPGLCAAYDDNAMVVRSGRFFRDLAESPVPPRSNCIHHVHTVEENEQNSVWVHTHGLHRAGLPELDLLGIPGPWVSECFEFLDGIVDEMLGGQVPDREGTFRLGEGLRIRALTPEVAGPLLRGNPDLHRGDGEESDDEHAPPRWILLDEKKAQAPIPAISRLTTSGSVYKPASESHRQRELSIHRFGTFGQLFAIHRNHGWKFHAKMGFERTSSSAVKEHLWFEVVELVPGFIRGRLLNQPIDVAGLQLGQEHLLPISRLTDWLIVTPDGNYDPEAAPLLLDDH